MFWYDMYYVAVESTENVPTNPKPADERDAKVSVIYKILLLI